MKISKFIVIMCITFFTCNSLYAGHHDKGKNKYRTPQTSFASLNNNQEQGNADSAFPSINGNGRFVVFHSKASNFDIRATDGEQQIFVYDRKKKNIELVSVNKDGIAGNGLSANANISYNGRYVTYWSVATNLVDDDTNDGEDVFLYDRKTGKTRRVSVNTTGSEGKNIVNTGILGGHGPAISGNGHLISWWSTADNLVEGDVNGTLDVFLRDVNKGITRRISVNSEGEGGNGGSAASWISSNGQFIGFHSAASNLIPDDTNGHIPDVFIVELSSDNIQLISRNENGEQGNDRSLEPYFSYSGRYVAYGSWANNLVPDDTNNARDVFVYDMKTQKLERVSVDNDGVEFPGNTFEIAISGNGRYAVMLSAAVGGAPGKGAIWLYDRELKTLEQVNVDADGLPGSGIFGPTDPSIPSISYDGRFVAFWSTGDTLIVGDDNNARDVFVRDFGKKKRHYEHKMHTNSDFIHSVE